MIKVFGTTSDKDKKFTLEKTEFFANLIFGKNKDTLNIHVSWRDDLPFSVDGVALQRAPNSKSHFEVLIRSTLKDTSENNFVYSLCHEMCHLKQFYTGILNDAQQKGGVYFMDRFYPVDRLNDVDWAIRPWEVQAEGLAQDIITKFTKYKIEWR